MKVPFSWLKDYVNITVTPQELADKMVRAGFEVEEIINLADSYKNIHVARILSVEQHPNADKLVVCKLDCGEFGEKQIVTGAKNVAAGDIVPVCLHGAVLPDGKQITKGKLRGVLSEGMMCGGSELGLTEDDFTAAGVDGIFQLDNRCAPGTDINEYLGTNDYILDIGVTANRPDCNSIIGIAREVAAVLDVPFIGLPIVPLQESGDISDYVSVKVLNKELCPRYMAKAVKNVHITKSPEYIRRRLRKVGLRPINNVVDITNYVLIEVGQPMHSFDADTIGGKQIIVRQAEKGEHIITLDGKDNVLDNDNLVICDSEKPVALAGIMGGVNSGIAQGTTGVVFESARFKRDNIRRSSKRLGIRSDSSSRFEKGIDFYSQELAINRACSLLVQQGSGEVVGGCIDIFDGYVSKTVSVRPEKIDEILGISIPAELMVSFLNRLSFNVVFNDGIITLQVPEYREDIENANDVAEEVIRMYGYDTIVGKPMDGLMQTSGGRTPVQMLDCKLKNYLSGALCYNEAVSYSFVSPSFADKLRLPAGDYRRSFIELINPLGEELSVMRTTLLHSMLLLVYTNQTRGNKAAKLYEFGKVYIPKQLPLTEYADERSQLMLCEYGEGNDFYSLKGTLEGIAAKLNLSFEYRAQVYSWLHPGRSADVFANGEYVGYIGELSPDCTDDYKLNAPILVAELSLSVIYAQAKEFLPFRDLPKFPAVTRDLAFVVDKCVESQRLLECIKHSGGKLLESAEIFDVYCGKGIAADKKSIAVALAFRVKDRTLVDTEVNAVIDKIIANAQKELGALLR